MKMKIKDTLDIDSLMLGLGIFSKIKDTTDQPFEWLTDSVALSLDEEYYLNHSGEKTISPLFKRLLNYQEEHPLINAMNKLALMIINKYEANWNKLYESIVSSDYNPIENYSMKQVETPDITMSSKQKSKTSTDNSNSVYGFNSSTPVPANEGNVTSESLEADNTTESKETGTRQLTRSGNIGVTTSQQMIESEIILREKNFFNLIMKDVDTMLTIPYYD